MTIRQDQIELVDLTTDVSGILPLANGGSGIDLSGAIDGQLLIGGTASNDLQLATLTGTADQVNLANSTNSITLSLPQSIATTSIVEFGRLGLGVTATTGERLKIDATGSSEKAIELTSSGTLATTMTIDTTSPAGLVCINTSASAAISATFEMDNASNTGRSLRGINNGAANSTAIQGWQTGLGKAADFLCDNATSTKEAVLIKHVGLAKGLIIQTTNASNTLATIEVIQSGTGPVAILTGDVMIGTGNPTEKLEVEGSIKSSVSGTDGNFSFDNASAVETIKGDTNGVSFFNGGNFGVGTITPDRLFHVEEDTALTNTVNYNARLTHTTSGTPAASIGVGIEFEQETSASNLEILGTFEYIATDVTGAAEDAAAIIKLMEGGAAATEKFRADSSGITITGEEFNLSTVSAAGATPVDTDVSSWANDSMGVIVGTGGRVFFTFKNSTDVYYVEATAL